jgi:N6-L-threonylcarbamoyladenine synthase
MSERRLADIAASFQAACVDVIARKVQRAVKRVGARGVIIGGGVSANRGLHQRMHGLGPPVYFPAMEYCTDNAAMSAGLGHVHLRAGGTSGLDLDAVTQSQFVGR